RIDGLTSLAVLFGAAGVWFGYALADPIVGLLITIAIAQIVWQSSKAIFARMLDGVEPAIIDEIREAASAAKGVEKVSDVRARCSSRCRRARKPPARTRSRSPPGSARPFSICGRTCARRQRRASA